MLPKRVIELSLSSQKTHVFVLLLSFCRAMNTTIWQKCGSSTRTKLIDIKKITTVLGEDTCRSPISVHAFTGCDSVSAFAGKKKARMMQKSKKLSLNLGKEWQLPPDLFTCIYRAIHLRSLFISSYWSECCALQSLPRMMTWNPFNLVPPQNSSFLS